MKGMEFDASCPCCRKNKRLSQKTEAKRAAGIAKSKREMQRRRREWDKIDKQRAADRKQRARCMAVIRKVRLELGDESYAYRCTISDTFHPEIRGKWLDDKSVKEHKRTLTRLQKIFGGKITAEQFCGLSLSLPKPKDNK